MQALSTLLEEREWRVRLQPLMGSIGLSYAPVPEVSSAFKPMVREAAFDCGELAIVTFLQAYERGAPLILLPFVVSGRPAHRSIACNVRSGIRGPRDLVGKRIGIRSYSQASGMWVRSILQHEHGVLPSDMSWVTIEDAHVTDFADPPDALRLPPRSSLKDLLIAGEIDAAIIGSRMPEHADVARVIPDADAAGAAWIEREGVWPINHMFVVSTELFERSPDVVRRLHAALVEARGGAGPPFPRGVDDNWHALDLASRFALEQGLIKRHIPTSELLGPARSVLDN